MGKLNQLASRAKEVLKTLNDDSFKLSADERMHLITELEILECQLEDTEWSVDRSGDEEE